MTKLMEDLSGQVFNQFTVLRKVRNSSGAWRWLCKCSCGEERLIAGSALKKGKIKSCSACAVKYRPKFGPIEDLTGEVFGYLTVIEYVGRDRNTRPVWRCKCVCGTLVELSSYKLKKKVKDNSCGCVRKAAIKSIETTKEHKSSKNIKNRDLTGKRFGSLTVLCKGERINKGPASDRSNYYYQYWTCRCDCGNITKVEVRNLVGGRVKSCGCTLKLDIEMGKKYGTLTALREVRLNDRRYIQCVCDCGVFTNITPSRLVKAKTCGCENYINYSNTTYKKWSIIRRHPYDWEWLCKCTQCGHTTILGQGEVKSKKCPICAWKTPKPPKPPKIPLYLQNRLKKLGQQFGDLTIIDFTKEGSSRHVVCKCTCGTIINTTYMQLTKGSKTMCQKCITKDRVKQTEKDMIGKRFDRLLVLSRVAIRKNTTHYLCICDCGKIREYSAYMLKKGNNRSCGCLRFEVSYQGRFNFSSRSKGQIKREKDSRRKIYKDWRSKVITRDDSTCQICGEKIDTPVVHHLLAYSKYNKHRYDPNNGMTMCKECHNSFHRIYTSSDFTIEDLIEYIRNYSKILPVNP